MISIIPPFTRKSESNGYHASVRLLMLQKAFPYRPSSRRLADGALTRVAAKVCRAGDLLTEKNCLNPSKPESFRLHQNRENIRKKPRHPKMTRLS